MSAASARFAAGTIARVIPDLYAAISAGSTPRTGRIFPSSASSPSTTILVKGSCGTVPCAIRIASAIDRSKLDPLFGSQAGDRETVTFRLGHVSLQLVSAARTRSRDS